MSEANNSLPTPPSPSKKESDISSPKQISKESWSGRIKSYAWRLTAAYAWFKILAALLGFYTALNQLESGIISQFISFLSSIGFAPVNTAFLSTVLKVGWVLAITGFNLFEVVGLFIYIVTFPVWVPVLAIFGFFSKDEEDTTESSSVKQGLIRRKRTRSRLFAICTSLFIGWFLLYGNANTQRQLIPGVVLAGVFLLLLTYRLFLRVKPDKEVNLSPFYWLTRLSLTAGDAQKERLKKEYKKRNEIRNDKKLVSFNRKLFVRIALLLRGQIAQERISMYVLGEYIFSLIIVAASAVLFWALMIKAMYSTSLPLLMCLHLSISHFLPSLQPPEMQLELPLWASIGPAATAWVLFVLYIGPASSVLPERQKATIRGLSRIYVLYRQSINVLGKEELSLRILEKKLAS